MTDVLDRSDTRTSPNTAAKARLKIIDCDIHPSLRSRADLNPFLSKRWQEHMETYGRPPAHALYLDDPLSALRAAAVAPRRLAADRRTARLRPRLHAPAAPRSRSISSSVCCRCSIFSFPRSRTWSSASRCSAPSTSGKSSAGASPSRASRPRSSSDRTMRRPPSPRSSAARRPASTCRSTSRRAPTSRSDGAATGRSTRRRRRQACRSASTSAATAATRRRAAAGPPTTTRSTTPTPTRWRRS